MAYCKHCGSEVNENAYACVKCGCALKDEPTKSSTSDIPAFLWGILGYFVPVAGLILWILWKGERPLDAKAAGLGALINTILSVVLITVYVFLYVFMFATTFGSIIFLG
ncbi:MAG: zinc ribbon domain-containing protein [Clostridia bacterium]|nr:zinc ribbon domain-containing protein [Clostridia bacterium]